MVNDPSEIVSYNGVVGRVIDTGVIRACSDTKVTKDVKDK